MRRPSPGPAFFLPLRMMSSSDYIAASLIVRNEEGRLRQCLGSVLPFVSQTVVTDTGSTDATPRLCALAGVELFFACWGDDFSAARNAGLRYVRRPWVLSIDADEQLSGSLDTLMPLLADPSVGGITVVIRSYNADGTTYDHRFTRIFRSHPDIAFAGAIHEQVSPSIIALGLRIVDSDVVIHHDGYRDISPEKLRRNEHLLSEEIARNPDDAYSLFHLAATHFAARNNRRAEPLFRRALELNTLSGEQRELAGLRLAQIALQDDDTGAALAHTRERCSNVHLEGFRHFLRMVAFLHRRDWDTASTELSHPSVAQSPMIPQQSLETARTLLRQVLR